MLLSNCFFGATFKGKPTGNPCYEFAFLTPQASALSALSAPAAWPKVSLLLRRLPGEVACGGAAGQRPRENPRENAPGVSEESQIETWSDSDCPTYAPISFSVWAAQPSIAAACHISGLERSQHQGPHALANWKAKPPSFAGRKERQCSVLKV